LLLFYYAIFQFTFNNPSDQFTQFNLAILLNIPTQEHVDAFPLLVVYTAPAGIKWAPEEQLT